MLGALASFVALWVVFAPAWGHEAGGGAERVTDLAARVLAPTFDRVALRYGPGLQTKLEQLHEANDGTAAQDAALPPITATLLLLGCVRRMPRWKFLLAVTETRLLQFGRAPPPLQLS